MHSQIFVNLPVKDLKRAIDFYTRLGYTFNPQFTNENATCMILGDNLFAMLLVEKFFSTFTDKAIADASKSTTALISLSCNSKAQVDDLVARARAAGGKVSRPPDDHGFMYSHDYQDLDGHGWGLFFMTGAPPEHLNKP
jgi:predicted lactoylglutathione lyase